jgi:uncharacterized protein YbjT (DUF2867 family)
MRIIVAGASGAIGRQLVPMLAEAGHTVVGLTRSESKTSPIEAAGAEAIVADVLDAKAVESALRAARPEVVVHELTAIPPVVNPRRFAEEFAPTNRLRREGTRNLVAAASAAGSRRIIVQSIAQAYARGASNAKAKRLLGWAPRYATWREGFLATLVSRPTPFPYTRRLLLALRRPAPPRNRACRVGQDRSQASRSALIVSA